MVTITLNEEEVQLIEQGLNCRMCFIETGHIGTRAVDVQKLGEHAKELGVQLNPLALSQMEVILKSEYLIRKLRGGK